MGAVTAGKHPERVVGHLRHQLRTGREQSLEAGAGVVEFQSTGFSRSESCQEPGRGFCSECAGADIKQVAFERERQAREIDVLNLLLVVATVDQPQRDGVLECQLVDRWEFGAGAVECSTQGDRPLGVFDVLKLVEFIPEVRAPHAVGRFHGLGCDWIVGRQWRMVRIVVVEEPALGVWGDVKVVLGPARVVGFFLEDLVGLFICRFPVMVSRAPDQHQDQPQPTQGHP